MKPNPPKTCLYCLKSFDRSSNSKYCSRQCYERRPLLEKSCELCGKPIPKRPMGARKMLVFTGKKFCSKQCMIAARQKRRFCQVCKIEILHRSKKKPKYFCSVKCRHEGMRKYPVLTCEQCGQAMRSTWRRPYKRDRRFCSFHCYHSFKGETTIETTVRIWLEEQCIPFVQYKQLGRYTVDFYLPEYHVAIEADGEYWHGKKRKPRRVSAKRQAYLDSVGVIVIRLPESTIKDASFIQKLNGVVRGRTLNLWSSESELDRVIREIPPEFK